MSHPVAFVKSLGTLCLLGALGSSCSLKSTDASKVAAEDTSSKVSFALGSGATDGDKVVIYSAASIAVTKGSYCLSAKLADCVGASASFSDGKLVRLKDGSKAFQSSSPLDPSVTPFVTARFETDSGATLTRSIRVYAKGTKDPVSDKADDGTCSDLVSNASKRVLYTNPSKVELTEVERQMICYTLNVRVLKAGRSAMTVDPTLMKNARAWAAANARDHAPNRHSGQNVAENAFHTVPNAKIAVAGWENSSGHYANIVGPYTKIGVGVAHENGGNGIPHWIEQFIW